MAIFLEDQLSEEDMKSMQFHEMRFFDRGQKAVLRTVGGYIYMIYKTYTDDDGKKQFVVNSVFVPYSE